MQAKWRVHGSCASKDGAAVLITGPSGAGKSDLVLRLLARGFTLVADDQVEIQDGIASAPGALAGLLEVRGLGIVRLAHVPSARIALVVRLGEQDDRLPHPHQDTDLNVPVVLLPTDLASAVDRVALALDCATGRVTQVAGAFAA
jgi:HPr kinase/phosphorylase